MISDVFENCLPSLSLPLLGCITSFIVHLPSLIDTGDIEQLRGDHIVKLMINRQIITSTDTPSYICKNTHYTPQCTRTGLWQVDELQVINNGLCVNSTCINTKV